MGPATAVRGDSLGLVKRTQTWSDSTDLYIHPRTVRVSASAIGFIRDIKASPHTISPLLMSPSMRCVITLLATTGAISIEDDGQGGQTHGASSLRRRAALICSSSLISTTRRGPVRTNLGTESPARPPGYGHDERVQGSFHYYSGRCAQNPDRTALSIHLPQWSCFSRQNGCRTHSQGISRVPQASV